MNLIVRPIRKMVSANGIEISADKPLAKILIVDDERDIVDVLKTGLERSGFETVAYSDPMLALEHFSKHSGEYCLAVTDIRMP